MTGPALGAVAGLSGYASGKGPGCHPSELGVLSLLVVVAPPVFQHGANMGQGAEQGFIEQLIAQLAIEALVIDRGVRQWDRFPELMTPDDLMGRGFNLPIHSTPL